MREAGALNFDLSFTFNMLWFHGKLLFAMITEK